MKFKETQDPWGFGLAVPWRDLCGCSSLALLYILCYYEALKSWVTACGCQEALWCFMLALTSISGPTKVKVSPCLQEWQGACQEQLGSPASWVPLTGRHEP